MELQELINTGLSEDVAKSVLAMHETTTADLTSQVNEMREQVEKLAKSNEGLLNDKQKWKAQREQSEAEKLEAMRKAGQVEELEANLTQKFTAQIESLQGELSKRDAMILGGKSDAIIAELAGNFVDADLGKQLLSNMVQSEYNDSGEVVVSLKSPSGELLTTDVGKFKETLNGVESFQKVLKGLDASGGGAAPGSNHAGGAGMDKVAFERAQRRKEKGLI